MMPPVWKMRTGSAEKSWSQSMVPGLSWEMAVWPRSIMPRPGADAEAALKEVDAVAGVAAYAVEGLPVDVRGVDATLEDEVFDEAADGVVYESCGDGGAEVEAAAEAAGDVVLAATFPDAEAARADDAAFAGIEAQHHFAEGKEVPAARGGRAEGEGVVCGRLIGRLVHG